MKVELTYGQSVTVLNRLYRLVTSAKMAIGIPPNLMIAMDVPKMFLFLDKDR